MKKDIKKTIQILSEQSGKTWSFELWTVYGQLIERDKGEGEGEGEGEGQLDLHNYNNGILLNIIGSELRCCYIINKRIDNAGKHLL